MHEDGADEPNMLAAGLGTELAVGCGCVGIGGGAGGMWAGGESTATDSVAAGAGEGFDRCARRRSGPSPLDDA